MTWARTSDDPVPECWDVVIIGAGPAAMATVLALSPDQRVLIADRRRAPWRKPCDGILTPMSLRLLAGAGIEVRDLAETVPARTLRVADWDNGGRVNITLQDHLMVDRKGFDDGLRQYVLARPGTTLLDCARVLGCDVVGMETLVSIDRGGRRYRVRACHVVDASGAAGFSRRLGPGALPTGLAVQFWYPPQGDAERCEWIFNGSVTPYYMWAIRKPAALILGGVFPLRAARKAKDAIERWLKPALGINGTSWRRQAGAMALPFDDGDIRLAANSMLVVGEAAGLINLGTGEGISFALRSGDACGRSIAEFSRCACDAAQAYQAAAADLAREAKCKARHGALLFDAGHRRVCMADDYLVPIWRGETQKIAV